MKTVELRMNGRKYLLKANDDHEHVEEVAELVKRKIEGLRKQKPTLTLQNAALLAAFDFAAQTIVTQKNAQNLKAAILEKAEALLNTVESKLHSLN